MTNGSISWWIGMPASLTRLTTLEASRAASSVSIRGHNTSESASTADCSTPSSRRFFLPEKSDTRVLQPPDHYEGLASTGAYGTTCIRLSDLSLTERKLRRLATAAQFLDRRTQGPSPSVSFQD